MEDSGEQDIGATLRELISYLEVVGLALKNPSIREQDAEEVLKKAAVLIKHADRLAKRILEFVLSESGESSDAEAQSVPTPPRLVDDAEPIFETADDIPQPEQDDSDNNTVF